MSDNAISTEPAVDEQSNVDPSLAQANKLYQTGVLLIFSKRKAVDRAIKCIQKAITLHDSDYRYWQLLGEAYCQRGSLNPAINCFLKSLNLAEYCQSKLQNDNERIRLQADCTYSKLRMSDIRLSVAHFDEAIAGYSDIIKIDPNNVAALIGMSKSELLVGKNSFSSNLVKTGHSHCTSALKYALMAIKLKPNLCLTWKLASDCCLIQFVHGQRGDFKTKLDIQFPGADSDGLKLDRFTCIDLAQRFLSKAISIESFEHSACLWHNLGISIYLKSTLIRDYESEQRIQLLKRSLKCLIKALDYDRINSQIRNSIGIVAFHLNYLNVAQSFIIKSIQTNMSTSEVQFSNLGFIFLQRGEYRLASVAFNRSQAEEPLYCRSWLGNALINETKNEDNLSLLRHCHRLESNYEAQLMYATKVSNLPHELDYCKDVVNAMDCMRNLVNYDTNSCEAQNTLGLLYERSGFAELARLSYDSSLKISPNNSCAIFNRLRQHCTCSDCVNTNRQMSDPEFINKAEKLVGSNVGYMLNYIYHLFNNKDFNSFETLVTKLLSRLQDSDVKNKVGAQILLALKAKTDGRDYKSWLFKNIIDADTVQCVEVLINLLTLLLFGSLSDDSQLVEQVSSDLGQYLINYISCKNVPYTKLFYSIDGFWTQLTVLSSIFCLQDTSKMVRPLVVMFPNIAEHWYFFGLALTVEQTNDPLAQQEKATLCLKRAKLIESTNANLSVACDILLAILDSETINLKGKDRRNSLLCRAIFKCPNYELIWTVLNGKTTDSPVSQKASLFEGNSSKKRKQSLLHHLNGQDLELFHLVIDHTIKMLVQLK